jgi:hypothetical protein
MAKPTLSPLVLALERQKSPQQALDDTQTGWEAILANGP